MASLHLRRTLGFASTLKQSCSMCRLLSTSNLASSVSRKLSSTSTTSSTSQNDEPMPLKFLQRGNGNSIAYKLLQGGNPGIIFCPGFQSTMEGVKANALEQYCRKKELSYVRFDYQGCGQSEGDLKEVTFSDWRGDALAILDQVTAGPQIVVGSSMGGLVMLHTALERPHRIHALVGIATSASFPISFPEKIPEEMRAEIDQTGSSALTDEDGYSYIFSKKFLDELKTHPNLLNMDSIPVTCPVRLLHGMKDEVVPYRSSVDLAPKFYSRDVNVLLCKSGDHRFSHSDDIQLMFEILDYLIFGTPEARNLALESWATFTVYQQQSDLLWKDRLLHKYLLS